MMNNVPAPQLLWNWPGLTRIANGAVELAATYFFQSSLMIGLVWLVIFLINRRSAASRIHPALAERLWKMAAVFSLVTAPISTFGEWSRPTWVWSFEHTRDRVSNGVSESTVEILPDDQHLADNVERYESHDPIHLVNEPIHRQVLTGVELPQFERFDKDPREPVLRSDIAPATEDFAPPRMESISAEEHLTVAPLDSVAPRPAVIAPQSFVFHSSDSINAKRSEKTDSLPTLAWFGIALIVWGITGIGRMARNALRMRRQLATCRPIEGEYRRLLNRIDPKTASFRLLTSRTFSEPFVCGLWHGTIVLPDGIEQRLTRGELSALLAHEAAHLIRRDLRWLWVGEFLCKCLAFQPLNFLVRHRWQQSSELLCDDWAVERRIPATVLANCLTRIAEWRLDRRNALMMLPAAGHSGPLLKRIEWLLRSERNSEPKRRQSQTFVIPLAFAFGLFVGTYGPRLTLSGVPVEASGDSSASAPGSIVPALWDEIDRDLTSTLNELWRMEPILRDDGDAEVVSLAKRLRDRAISLQSRQTLIQPKLQDAGK